MKIQFIDRKTGEIQTEVPPAEGLLKFLYDNPFGKTIFLSIAKRKFISNWYGKKMNAPASKKKIQDFVNQLGIDMSESEKSVSEFSSFNDFFYRKLKADARPIETGFVSPGDGKLIAFEKVSEVNDFFVKGQRFTLDKFLSNKQMAEQYQDGSMLILRLAPNDYHRFHFPYDGLASGVTKIKGGYMSVSPYALASNFAKVFCENKREFCVLKSETKGNIVIAPVGATMVGSIISTYQPNTKIAKGDEMGYFTFGGSTIVVLTEKGKLKIDEDILENTRNQMETFVKMGERIGE